MKGLIWIIVLFAAAVGLALAASVYEGNVYVVAGETMLRVNLHAFVIGLLLAVVVLYLLVRLLAGILNIPGRLQRFGLARKGRHADSHLQAAGLAYFEGKYQKAEQEAAKVLANKEAGEKRTLALMLAAHAADAMDNAELREQYLTQIAKLPQKAQLSRYLLQAESALNRRDYPAAQDNMQEAGRLNPNLTRLVRLQLRYAFDHGDALDVLDKAAKLNKAAAINAYETEQYQDWAYRRLLALANDAKDMKACLKRIPEDVQNGSLSAAIAEKFDSLGLYPQAVAWVKKHYPQNRDAALLKPFIHSVRYLDDRDQRKAIDTADGWLKNSPSDAELLMYLGQLAYSKQLWGKAQGYLEASLAVREDVKARLALAKVFDETGDSVQAEAQRKQALADATQSENFELLEIDEKAAS
ncbi:MAG: heme biosynthesis HemY N-terminal domain-containing protein [Neisseria sp.]|nr:heme biosynthesis HemY N-terminal domain-containing protein [Neisseria sp.]